MSVAGEGAGALDRGWLSAEIRDACIAATPAGRLGTPTDVAHLVRFLFSDASGWINAQVLHSDGVFRWGDARHRRAFRAEPAEPL